MKRELQKKFITCSTILLLFCIFINPAKAKVEKPNYNFTFEKLKPFYPGQKLSDIQKEFKGIRLINEKKPAATYEILIRHSSYFFPVFINVIGDEVLDVYARLPNYFLHDVFHQSLINRYGPQDSYLNKDETSVYIWNDEEGLTITYSGACTITCFPIFVHMIKKDQASNPESLLKKTIKAN